MMFKEAIEHCEEKTQDCDEYASEHGQLATRLKELMEQKMIATKIIEICNEICNRTK